MSMGCFLHEPSRVFHAGQVLPRYAVKVKLLAIPRLLSPLSIQLYSDVLSEHRTFCGLRNLTSVKRSATMECKQALHNNAHLPMRCTFCPSHVCTCTVASPVFINKHACAVVYKANFHLSKHHLSEFLKCLIT